MPIDEALGRPRRPRLLKEGKAVLGPGPPSKPRGTYRPPLLPLRALSRGRATPNALGGPPRPAKARRRHPRPPPLLLQRRLRAKSREGRRGARLFGLRRLELRRDLREERGDEERGLRGMGLKIAPRRESIRRGRRLREKRDSRIWVSAAGGCKRESCSEGKQRPSPHGHHLSPFGKPPPLHVAFSGRAPPPLFFCYFRAPHSAASGEHCCASGTPIPAPMKGKQKKKRIPVSQDAEDRASLAERVEAPSRFRERKRKGHKGKSRSSALSLISLPLVVREKGYKSCCGPDDVGA